ASNPVQEKSLFELQEMLKVLLSPSALLAPTFSTIACRLSTSSMVNLRVWVAFDLRRSRPFDRLGRAGLGRNITP
ncbi:MAG: hypothetical protein M3P51_06590, partial [Chloroflexota bacterium]|nr:hypothetical protein [Chloroflexota bacterium]